MPAGLLGACGCQRLLRTSHLIVALADAERAQAATLQAEMMRQQQARLLQAQHKRDLKSTYR